MVDKRLIVSAAGVLFGVSILVAAGLLSATLDLGPDRIYDLQNVAGSAALITFGIGAVYSDRAVGDLEGWEILAVGAVVVLVAAQLADVQMVTQILEDHHPWSGLALSGLAYGGYWTLGGR